MLARLRWQFIAISMSFVCVVLLVVFALLGGSTYQRLVWESEMAMRQMLTRDAGHTPPKFEIGGRAEDRRAFFSALVFCVAVDENGDIRFLTPEYVEVAEELAALAVQQAQQSQKPTGVLAGLGLRYIKEQTPNGMKYAFADMSAERSSLTGFLLTSLLVGAGGLGAFFVASLFLAGWALRPVQKAWERQRRFVADASHELKTPLTVILTNIGILLAHPQDTIAQQSKWVENTKAEADRMKRLVDDLLFLAKADAPRLPQAHQEINLSDTVWSALLPFESIAYEEGLTLTSEITPGLKTSGSEGELRQLVAILLDNACKYAGEMGRVTLQLEQSGDHARLSVNNTGKPIDPAHLPHLFERFYRADESRCRKQDGYGLGLSIAKQIAENHRARIAVESTECLGTTFIVTFVLKQ